MTFKGRARHEFLCFDIFFLLLLLFFYIACICFPSLFSSFLTHSKQNIFFCLKSNPDAPRHGKRKKYKRRNIIKYQASLVFLLFTIENTRSLCHIPPAMAKQDSHNSLPSMRAIQTSFKKINHKSFNFFSKKKKKTFTT
jgi:hypothetical protein